MGAPSSGMQAAEQPSAEALLGAFKTIKAAERGKHASVLNYWLSIRGDKEFPPLHDLDPLRIFRRRAEQRAARADQRRPRCGNPPSRRGAARRPRLARADHGRAAARRSSRASPRNCRSSPFRAISSRSRTISPTTTATTRCWVTLLPLSAGGAWVDYVYAPGQPRKRLGQGCKGGAKPAKAEPEPEVDEEPSEDDRRSRGSRAREGRRRSEEMAEEPVEEVADEPVEEIESPVEEVRVEPEQEIEDRARR